MQFSGRYFDGMQANPINVIAQVEGAGGSAQLVLRDAQSEVVITRWVAEQVCSMPARSDELNLALKAHSVPARLYVHGQAAMDAVHSQLPSIKKYRRVEKSQQWKITAVATSVLAGFVALYIFGVPLIAGQLVQFFPPEWERRLGETAAIQVEASIAEDYGFEVCDTNPYSVANTAIRRFVDLTLTDVDTPFDVNITVARSTLPNAFALPGGQSYFLSALLDEAENFDEFAGVMAHEIGHVVHRHGTEQLISSAGTGLLIGFLLGDMTGLSVAGGLGATLIDSRNSRDAERQADQFAADTAKKLGFNAGALADLLNRVAGDDAFTAALALLSSHPLTEERRLAMENTPSIQTAANPLFTVQEWTAIKTMCAQDDAPDSMGISTDVGGKPRKGVGNKSVEK